MRKILTAGVSLVALSATGALADGTGEVGDIQQYGLSGAAYIEQDTESASAFILQGLGSDGDTAAIVQTEAGTDGLSASITQNSFGTGYGNVAGVVQTNMDTGATYGDINQDGSSNTAGIRQRDSANGALVDQDGDENKAMVKQGDVPPGFAELEADAGNTTTDVDFSTVLNFDGSSGGIFADGDHGPAQYSYGEILQYGAGNRGVILQLGDTQFAAIDQIGDNNIARTQQVYEWNSAVVLQLGTDNMTDVLQHGSLGTATVDQDGSLNVALVEQGGEENTADVLQLGTENMAGLLQLGSHNYADVQQDGSLNVALVEQRDTSGDQATIWQTGDSNMGMVHQSHDEVVSIARIEQYGSHNVGFINQ